jgi:3-deoxy-manno-octulosonate cytidylyltransferase (CMP-KDO synthetase)
VDIVGVIPARYGSTRFPGKLLAPLQGRPLILHTIESARSSRRLTQLVVATDDDRIAEAARSSGVEVCMTSPDCASGSDRAAEAVRNRPADLIVNLQGDEPLVEGDVIDRVIAGLLDAPDCGVSTPVVAIHHEENFTSPHVVKAVVDLSAHALYFSRAPIASTSRLQEGMSNSADFVWGWKHLGLYAFRRETLLMFTSWPPSPLERREQLEQLRLLENGIKIRIVEVEKDSIGVDTPEELAELNRRLSAAGG